MSIPGTADATFSASALFYEARTPATIAVPATP